MAKRKRRRLRIDRVIIAVVVLVLAIFGVYEAGKTVIGFVSSWFNDSSETVQVQVQGEIIGTVVLDAGHGGKDVGAEYEDVYEKDINLIYVTEIGEYLTNHGVQVIYTRTDDSRLANTQILDLKARCEVGKDKADYYIAIHINSLESQEEVSGFEIYYEDDNEQSHTLANHIAASMEALDYTKNRGVSKGNSLYVIRNNTVTPVLVELGYFQGDHDYLLDENDQKKLSEAIAQGIIETFK